MNVISSTSLSTRRSVKNSPIIEHFEYHWGMERGDLSLDSQMNHIKQCRLTSSALVRSDMVQRLRDSDWVFMPTQDTLQAMYELVQYNMTAPIEARKRFLDVFPDKEYEYDVVPLCMNLKKRAALYAHGGAHIKAFQAPFANLPRIKSRAHPFFVVFMSSELLDGCAVHVMPMDRAELLMSSAGRIVSCWMKEPPATFLVGPDVWKQHRHPLSDDGKEARTALGDSRRANVSPMRLRRSTRAPCRQQKVATSVKPYARYDLRPTRTRGSALPRSGFESGEEDDHFAYDIADLRAWVDKVERRRGASSWPATWIDKEAADDDMLARYRRESARDADDALHPQTTRSGGGVALVGHDRSRYSSNNWAMRTQDTVPELSHASSSNVIEEAPRHLTKMSDLNATDWRLKMPRRSIPVRRIWGKLRAKHPSEHQHGLISGGLGGLSPPRLKFVHKSHNMSAVPSECISEWKHMQDYSIVDYKVVDLDEGRFRRQKGDLDLSSPLNHIRLRADMAESLEKLRWTLIPTQNTLRKMQKLSEYNMSADIHRRKDCLKEIPGEVYEYDFVPLYCLKKGRPTLYVSRGKTTRAVRAPYTSMPRIKTRAHPLFVTFMADDQFDMCISTVMPAKKAKTLSLALGDIVTCWSKPPPSEFLVGPDVWKEHRHPLSDDGHESDECELDTPLQDARKGNMSLRSGVRKTTRAPCKQAKTTAATKPYTKLGPRPLYKRSSALPRPGVKYDDERPEGAGYPLSELRAWVDGAASQSQRRATRASWRATWIEEEAKRDALLAQYRTERARDAANALDPHTNLLYSGGTIMGTSTDWAGHSSNNWASRIHGVCLMGENVFARAAK
ncbi:uncharacterized protein SCHCODRAFT_02602659 [Schizophyllum commune H4-8]|uniref:Uncharacterized protein n=1 Tax=Schizophyllum commune (strain H4-8 / FGSC 9210) TaxID=578458 RepID=D8QGX3_SCHCM|nr:uncharacterized protein SCHCODRAFT_02602659 [Schizophyllum commune H4-8]KAI5886936.1 hypothetical protein SCHCODRAFT_02602659 [Schizophyllum commune H4-8]